jgi:hypothetical protein
MKYMILFLLALCFSPLASSEIEESRLDIFSYGPSGVGADYTPMMKMIISHSKNRDAENDFYLLTTMRNGSIRLYGLVGLKIVGSKRFEECKNEMLKSEEIVLYGVGCKVYRDKVQRIVMDIAESKLTDFLRKEDVPN